jgi:hypothetical protein
LVFCRGLVEFTEEEKDVNDGFEGDIRSLKEI